MASDWYSLGVLVFKLLTGVWYDAHMAVRETLETYDPVWLQILPKLLHANPQGRECLSWTELKATADEAAAVENENVLATAQRDQSRLRWIAGVSSAVLALAFIAALFCGWRWKKVGEQALAQLREEQQRLDELQSLPDFDSTVRIPRDVPSGDGDGADELTRDDYKLARIDAWVLTHSIFSDLKKGVITREDAIKDLSDLAKRAARDDEVFTGERFEYYDSLGDATVLAHLLSGAVSNLQERVRQ